jgi:hypothetical protein
MSAVSDDGGSDDGSENTLLLDTTPLLEPPTTSATQRILPKDLPALHAVRLLATIHVRAARICVHTRRVISCVREQGTSRVLCQIAVYHTVPNWHYGGSAWGATWVPFFFLLSGFGPAHSRLLDEALDEADASSPPPLCMSLATLLRRLAAVYPTHALGVLTSACVGLARAEPLRIRELAVELLLLHAWLPAQWTLFHCSDDGCSDFRAVAYNVCVRARVGFVCGVTCTCLPARWRGAKHATEQPQRTPRLLAPAPCWR